MQTNVGCARCWKLHETLHSGALLLWRNSLASWHSIRSEKSISAKTRELFFNVFHAELSKRAYHRLPLFMENWMPEFHPQKPRIKFRNLTCCYREGTLSWNLRFFFTLKRKCWNRKSANEVGRCFFQELVESVFFFQMCFVTFGRLQAIISFA